MKKRIFSRLMAMIMALSLLSTTGFAASFSALQDAIDGKSDTNSFTAEDGTTRYGYGEKNTETNKWGIEAWDTTDSEGKNTRNVQLNEDVEFDAEKGDTTHKEGEPVYKNGGTYASYSKDNVCGILIDGRTNGKDKSISIDLNGNTIDLNPGKILKPENGKFYEADANGKRTDKEVDDKDLNKGAVIAVYCDGDLTITDSSTETWVDKNTGEVHYVAGTGTGKITGGNNQNVCWWSQGGSVTVYDSDLTVNGVNISGNRSAVEGIHGGAIGVVTPKYTPNGYSGSESVQVNLNGVKLSENYSRAHGGALHIDSGVLATLKDSIVKNNHAYKQNGAIWGGSTLEIINTSFCGNREEYRCAAGGYADADHHVWGDMIVDTPATCRSTGVGHKECKSGCREDSMDNLEIAIDPNNHDGDTEIRGAKDPTCTEDGYTGDTYCQGCKNLIEKGEVRPALGHEYGDWYVTREAQPGVAGEERHDCVRGDAFETRPIPALPMPVDFGDTTGSDTGTTIDDEATPLAGLFTRADAIGYLWEHTGSPEAELSTFADVPEDHYWAVAIGWAEDNGIALPDEEGNFRPDDLVLRTSDEPEGELQEFLNRYAVFAGVELEPDELFFVLDGAADDIIMGEDAQVIFDAFFAKLEKTLAEQEKAA